MLGKNTTVNYVCTQTLNGKLPDIPHGETHRMPDYTWYLLCFTVFLSSAHSVVGKITLYRAEKALFVYRERHGRSLINAFVHRSASTPVPTIDVRPRCRKGALKNRHDSVVCTVCPETPAVSLFCPLFFLLLNPSNKQDSCHTTWWTTK